MNYLLDTNILIWWLTGSKKINNRLKEIISNPMCLRVVSVASIWEIVIKNQSNKLNLVIPFERILKEFGFELLGINLEHVVKLSKLPAIHKDPFDRILVAQSKVEGLELLTSDKTILKYF